MHPLTNCFAARALTFADVYALPKAKLSQMLEDYPAVKNMVQKLALKAIFRESVLGYNNAVKNLMTGQRVFTQDRGVYIYFLSYTLVLLFDYGQGLMMCCRSRGTL